MAQRCTVCARPDAGTINAALLDGRSARSVALEVGVSDDALQRHAANHLARAVAAIGPPVAQPRVRQADRPSPADPIDELVEALRPHALKGDPQAAHQYRLALQAQADAQHAAPPVRALATEPEWIALRTRLLELLEPFPEALAALRDALR